MNAAVMPVVKPWFNAATARQAVSQVSSALAGITVDLGFSKSQGSGNSGQKKNN